MTLASWASLLAVLQDAAVQAAEPAARGDVVQLAGLCDRMDTEAFLPLRNDELSGYNGRRIWQFCELVNRVTGALVYRKIASLKTATGGGLYASDGTYYWGRYMNFSGVTCLLRFAPKFWAQDRNTPLWLQVGFKAAPPVASLLECLLPIAIADPDRVFSGDSFVDVALDLPIGDDERALSTQSSVRWRKWLSTQDAKCRRNDAVAEPPAEELLVEP